MSSPVSSPGSSPVYRLVYFDIPGLAETARILFRLAKVDFEDQRYPFDFDSDRKPIRKEWNADKEKYVYEKIPVLFTEGAEIAQSPAINRFLARRFGFFGSSEVESALIDAAIEQFSDVKRAYFKIRDQPAEVEKFYDNEVKDLFRLFSRQQEKLKSGVGHLIGNKLSLIDILIWQLPMLGNKEKLMPLIEQFPSIKAIYDEVEKTEGIHATKK